MEIGSSMVGRTPKLSRYYFFLARFPRIKFAPRLCGKSGNNDSLWIHRPNLGFTEKRHAKKCLFFANSIHSHDAPFRAMASKPRGSFQTEVQPKNMIRSEER